MLIAIVVLELLACLCLWVLIGAGTGGDEVAFAPLEAWLACATLQLTIHYFPRRPYARYGLRAAVLLMLLASVTLAGSAVPLYPQALFIAAVAVLPQLWLEWFSRITEARYGLLGLFGVLALPLGIATWIFANIWLVKIKASSASQGETYCILHPAGRLFSSGPYHKVPDDWSLSGWKMFSGRGAGGSGNCCQWDFHALLLTQSNQLFNWSYKSQRFERVSDRARRTLYLNLPTCP